jgi:hypothetical protein
MIRSIMSINIQMVEVTWFIRYFFYRNLQVIIIKTKVLLPQAQETVADSGYLRFFSLRHRRP